jgi:hypothetical protein
MNMKKFVLTIALASAVMASSSRGNEPVRELDSPITLDEAIRIATDYALEFDGLLVKPEELRGVGYLGTKTHYISVENAAFNNTYWCRFYVYIDAETRQPKPADSAKAWNCEFLADSGGGT